MNIRESVVVFFFAGDIFLCLESHANASLCSTAWARWLWITILRSFAVNRCSSALTTREKHESVNRETCSVVAKVQGERVLFLQSFREGMNKYLTRHEYQNAVTEDLWKALQEASGKPVDQFMDTFVKQMGFPLISVSSFVAGATLRPGAQSSLQLHL